MDNWLILTALVGWIIFVAASLSVLVHFDAMESGTAWRVGLALASLGLLSPLAMKMLMPSERTPGGETDDAVDEDPSPTDQPSHATTPEPSYEDDHDDDHVPADSDADAVWLDWHRRGRSSEED